eukprot:s359_g10.t1
MTENLLQKDMSLNMLQRMSENIVEDNANIFLEQNDSSYPRSACQVFCLQEAETLPKMIANMLSENRGLNKFEADGEQAVKRGKTGKVSWKGSWERHFPEENPKKKGMQSYGRFAAYMHARTISDALNFGACLRDLDQDYRRGIMACADADADVQSPEPCHAALLDSQDGGKKTPGKSRDRRVVLATSVPEPVLPLAAGPDHDSCDLLNRSCKDMSVQTKQLEVGGMECKNMFTQTEMRAAEIDGSSSVDAGQSPSWAVQTVLLSEGADA